MPAAPFQSVAFGDQSRSSFRVTTYASSPGVGKTENSEDYVALSRPIERDSLSFTLRRRNQTHCGSVSLKVANLLTELAVGRALQGAAPHA